MNFWPSTRETCGRATGQLSLPGNGQPSLVAASRALATDLRLADVSFVPGDAAEIVPGLGVGSVFFLYCPFSGDRLVQVLADLEPFAQKRSIRVCCVDLPLPPCDWLEPVTPPSRDLSIYRSVGERRSVTP